MPNEKREDDGEMSVLDVGGKPQRIIPGKTHALVIWSPLNL